jgi:hypothetical protein
MYGYADQPGLPCCKPSHMPPCMLDSSAQHAHTGNHALHAPTQTSGCTKPPHTVSYLQPLAQLPIDCTPPAQYVHEQHPSRCSTWTCVGSPLLQAPPCHRRQLYISTHSCMQPQHRPGPAGLSLAMGMYTGLRTASLSTSPKQHSCPSTWSSQCPQLTLRLHPAGCS